MLKGSCLCGAVRYEVHGQATRITHCHCSMCRKAHGAAFGSYAAVNAKDFTVTSGKDDIASYESSSEVARTFCRKCGATLQYIDIPKPEIFGLAVGTLDDDPGSKPVGHIFVGSKAPWFDITDDLVQYEAWPKK